TASPWKSRRRPRHPLRSRPTSLACTTTIASGSVMRSTWKCPVRCSLKRREPDMKHALRMLGVGLLAAMAAGLPAPARAADVRVGATDGALTQAIEQAAPGDRLLLSSGVHKGGLVINKPLTIEGEAGAI